MCDTDITSEQMDTEDNLEITAVYGTQLVCIKEEETEIEIKQESAVDKEDGETIYDHINIDVMLHDVTATPLVYTTRLDYMNTFNKIGRHTSKEAIEMIEKESKPHYDALKNNPEQLSDLCINSYNKLCSQIQQLKTKVQTETRLKNQILLNMCKPLQIVLEDLKTSKSTCPKKILDHRYSSDENVSSDEDKPISKLVLGKSFLARNATVVSTCIMMTITVAVKDKRSQEADIYILDAKKGVKSYYRTNMKECKTIEQLHKSKKTILLEYCCWVNREKRISRLIQLGFARSNIYYLRKPHNCLPRPCSCCCVFGTPILSKSNLILSITTILDNNEVTAPANTDNVIDKFDEISAPVNSNNVIDKANNYMLNLHDALQGPSVTNKAVDYLTCAVIIIKYHRIIFSQVAILGENYEIGKNGAVVNFMIPTVNRSITEERQLYENSDKKSNQFRLYFCYLICCWYNREDIINRLSNTAKLAPSVLRYIRTPHPCRSDKCVCCCKPFPFINLQLKNISTFQKSTSRKTKKVLPVSKDKEKLNLTSNKSKPLARYTLDDDVDDQSLKDNTSSRHKPSHRITKTYPPVYHNKPKTTQDSVNLALNSCSENNAIATNSHTTTVTKNKQLEPTVTETIDLTSADTDSTTSPGTLIDSILVKFKDLILTVNENSKLTAVISAAPGSLSTVEMKVISDILLLASTQIEQLGISPQEFCNRVNLSRTGNRAIPVPQLVPLQPSISPPENQVLNTLPTKLQHNNTTKDPNDCKVQPLSLNSEHNNTTKDPNGCKVQPLSLNSCIPKTSNTSNVCSIYQGMSSIGGLKNQNLIHSYKLHFKDFYLETDRQFKKVPKQQTAEKSVKKFTRPNYVTTSAAFAATAKRKAPQNPDPNLKKLRVKPPEELLVEIPTHPVRNLKTTIDQSVQATFLNTRKTLPRTAKNLRQLLVSNNNAITTPNTSVMNVSHTSAVVDHNPTTLIVKNSNNSNSNLKLEKNASKPVAPQFAMESIQVPLLNANSNVIHVQNTSEKNVSLTTGGPLHYLKNILITNNSNFILDQNTNATGVPQLNVEEYLHDQKPVFATNSKLLTVEDTSDTIVSPPTIENDETLVDISNLNYIKNCGFDETVTEVDNETHASNNNSLAMQNIIDAVVSSVAKKPIGPVPSGNPLLHQMLTQAHASPALPSSYKYRPRKLARGARNVGVQPVIRTYSRKEQFNKQKSNLKTNQNPVLNPNDAFMEIDFESSIQPTIISNLKPDKFTEDEVLDAVNNKQLIDSDEEDGIFGV